MISKYSNSTELLTRSELSLFQGDRDIAFILFTFIFFDTGLMAKLIVKLPDLTYRTDLTYRNDLPYRTDLPYRIDLTYRTDLTYRNDLSDWYDLTDTGTNKAYLKNNNI